MTEDNDKKEAPFWLVLSMRGEPTQKHKQKADAMLEAGRLAKKHIGTAFYVCEVQFGYVGAATLNKIHMTMEDEDV